MKYFEVDPSLPSKTKIQTTNINAAPTTTPSRNEQIVHATIKSPPLIPGYVPAPLEKKKAVSRKRSIEHTSQEKQIPLHGYNPQTEIQTKQNGGGDFSRDHRDDNSVNRTEKVGAYQGGQNHHHHHQAIKAFSLNTREQSDTVVIQSDQLTPHSRILVS